MKERKKEKKNGRKGVAETVPLLQFLFSAVNDSNYLTKIMYIQ